MKYLTIVFSLLILISCKNNKELEILEDKAPVTELKPMEEHMSAAKQFLREGKREEALKELSQSIRTYHNEEAYIMKSNILLEDKRYFEFLENTEDAMRFEQFQSTTLMMHNGLGYELTGQEEKAMPFYKKAAFQWALEDVNQQNYRLALSQKPFITAVVFNKETALKDFDKIFSDFARTRQDTLIKKSFRPLLEGYDGTGMSYFYNTIDENPTF